ncbi:MAG: isoleucine--tRNA ligase [Candidatus Pacearchaeota archaeon]
MYDFKKIEEEVRKFWKLNDKKIKNSLKDNKKKKIFSFLEGPPTANAPPGLHHLEVRTYKDIICKFKFMNGFSVPRKGGWDCHGLPVEVQVEKKLGLRSKKEVLKYGIGNFVNECRNDVFSFIKEWNISTEELGYWIDLENPYITLENKYIESVWWSLKELYNKKMLYEDHKVVHFCTRCGTPLSSHEVALGYKDVTEESVYIAFKLKDKDNEYILAWTTTPWTLPGNVALAIGEKIDYIKIELEDSRRLILAKDRIGLIKENYKIIEEMKGDKLIGLEYYPLFEIKQLRNKNSHKIIPAEFVSTEEGTGVVHIAVMYGEEDYIVGNKFGLPKFHTVGEDGKFLDIVPKFKGIYVKEAEEAIKNDLEKRGALFKKEKITHSYPFCWRCDTPLLYYAITTWFISVSKIKNELIELNKKINWEPEHIKYGRFGNWLDGAKDWAISRFKFWGTPLPIWRCEKCRKEKIIGSFEELKKNSIKKIYKNFDLHKPKIDEIVFRCDKCKGEMKRIPDVIDCWYDSGAASFAQFHYPFENKKEFERRFPYDFIAEAIDQTRGWFYTLHVLAAILFKKPAYKNVICAGHIVDENGEKMSKSKGNIIIPKEIFDKTGVDAVRLQFCVNDAGNTKRFSYNLMKESVIPFLIILYNINNYYVQLENKKLKKKRIEDKWILSKLNSLINDVTNELEKFSISLPFLKIMNFVVNDFSRNYIKITRDRNDNKEVIGECLKNVSLLLAPFAPYITEYIYKNFSKKSVHLSDWPKVDKKKINKNLEKNFGDMIKIIEAGMSLRDKLKIGLRWPLKKVKIYSDKIDNSFEGLIKQKLNVKNVEWVQNAVNSQVLEFDTEMTPELEAEGYARELTRQIQDFRKKLGLRKKNLVDTYVVVEESFKSILEKNKNFIKNRTNSKIFEIITDPNLIRDKETFKNKIDFKIKDKRGVISIVIK